MNTARVAYLGVGHPNAGSWAVAIAEHKELAIEKVYDADAEASRRFASSYGGAVCDSVAEALTGVDAVIIDGRNDQNAELAQQAVEAGIPTFIEKPGCRSAAELSEIARVAEDLGVPTQMGYAMRYSPVVSDVSAILSRGELGKVSLARFHSSLPEEAWTTMGDWFSDATNALPPFLEAGCHLVDVVRLLLGEPTDPSTTSVRWNGSPSPGEDALGTTLRCGDVVVAIDFTAHESDPWNVSFGGEIYGTEGTLSFHTGPARLSVRKKSDYAATMLHQPADLADRAAIEAVLEREGSDRSRHAVQAFGDLVLGRGASPVDARSGARTMQLIEDILNAAGAPMRTA